MIPVAVTPTETERALPCVVACGGGWIASTEAIHAGHWDAIRDGLFGASQGLRLTRSTLGVVLLGA